MLKGLKKYFSLSSGSSRGKNQTDQIYYKELASTNVSENIERNRDVIKKALGKSPDIIYRDLIIGMTGIHALVVYIEGLVDMAVIDGNVIKTLTLDTVYTDSTNFRHLTIDIIKEQIITVGEILEENRFEQVLKHLLSGHTLIFVQGAETALIVSALSSSSLRPVEEPATEAVIRGAREGFVESIGTNRVLLRRKLRSPILRFEETTVGSVSQTPVAVVYLDGIADKKLIDEVNNRIGRIKIDGIIESGYIEEFIHDAPFSPFPTVRTTERPDVVAANLLEGRAAILVDGTPIAMIVPATFVQFLQASEDYYQSFQYVFAIRLLRYLSFFITLFLPSVYIAVTTFHQEMLPSALALSIASSRQGIPFPAFIEALMMETAFEVLREAGVRLPRPIGQSVSIVGALVIGDAAVRAGIVSPAMVIIVSGTAIASFTMPGYTFGIAIRLMRFPIMILSAALGLFGVMMGGFILFVHMASLRSFGAPYLAPIAPAFWRGQKDVFVRAPWWAMFTRPVDTGDQNPVRVPKGQKPENPQNQQGGYTKRGKR